MVRTFRYRYKIHINLISHKKYLLCVTPMQDHTILDIWCKIMCYFETVSGVYFMFLLAYNLAWKASLPQLPPTLSSLPFLNAFLTPYSIQCVWNSVETVVLPDNGFGGPPAGMNHWHIVNTTVRSMGEGRREKEFRKGGRERRWWRDGADKERNPVVYPLCKRGRVKLPP